MRVHRRARGPHLWPRSQHQHHIWHSPALLARPVSYPAPRCRCYTRERGALPAGSLLEVPFTQLEGDPLGTLEQVYRTFG